MWINKFLLFAYFQNLNKYLELMPKKYFCQNILMMTNSDKLRADKYLWSIRIFKTRSAAAEACEKGKVKCNGNNIKAAKNVVIGEEYEIKTETRKWMIKVNGLLHTRVAYTEAVKYYTDITPQEDVDILQFQTASFHTGKRLSKIGRPTKKQRRDINDFLEE